MRCVSSSLLLLIVAAFLLVSLSVASFTSAFSIFAANEQPVRRFTEDVVNVDEGRAAVALPPAPANLLLDETLFNKLTAAVIPVINKMAADITIPSVGSKHFDIDSFKIQNFNLGPITFTFTSPSKVTVTLSEISFSIPSVGFKLKDKILFAHIHCKGHAHASVNIAASFSFDLTDTNGKIALNGGTSVKINYKTLNVGYKMDHTLCKIVSKLINFVLGGISDKIKHAIEKNLGPAIQKSLTGALAQAFARLPVSVTGSPKVSGGVLSVPINLAAFLHQQQQQQLALPPALSSSRQQQDPLLGDLTRDLAVELPASSANVLSEAVFAMGKLRFNHTERHVNTSILHPVIPAAYNICPNCPINIGVDARTVPRVAFTANNFSLTVANLSFDFKAFNQSTGQMIPLFTVSTNVGFSVGQFSITTTPNAQVVKFALGVQDINLVVTSSSVGKITDVATVNFIINLVKNTVVPTFNQAFPGIPVPTSGGFSLNDIFIQIGSGSFQAGFNVKI